MKKFVFLILFLPILSGCQTDDSSSHVPSDSSYVEPTGSRKLNFYAINDFHGAIIESDTEPGIFKLGSYLKDKFSKNAGKTVFVNTGDLWQGSADSNINRGEFLTRAMNVLDLDALTLGNHEFDWHPAAIEKNKAIADYPFLGANIVRRDTKELATNLVHYDDTFKASTMVSRNDVNIGIIGTMGSRLETSILATAVADYSFEEIEDYVRNEADNLRRLGANIIVLSAHEGVSDNLSSYQGIINDKLVDIIFAGHNHSYSRSTENGIPILRTEGNGRRVMEVDVTYNFDTKHVSIDRFDTTQGSYIKQNYDDDQELRTLFGEYEPHINEVKNEKLHTLRNTLYKNQIIELANELMFNYGKSRGYEETSLLAVHNSGGVRVNSFPVGVLTYGDVYKAFPFDNEIRIIENIRGADLYTFVDNGSAYDDHPSFPLQKESIDKNKTYNLITIDYLSTYEYSITRDMEQVLTGEYVRELIANYYRNLP